MQVLIYSYENISVRKTQVLYRSVEPLQGRVMVFCASNLASVLIISLLKAHCFEMGIDLFRILWEDLLSRGYYRSSIDVYCSFIFSCLEL
jgi:hypothetical protein